MNREEFKLKVAGLIAHAQCWQMSDQGFYDLETHRDLTKTHEKEIVAEFDRLKSLEENYENEIDEMHNKIAKLKDIIRSRDFVISCYRTKYGE